jgi:hypothetical protein
MHANEELKSYATDFIDDHRIEILDSDACRTLLDTEDENLDEIKGILKLTTVQSKALLKRRPILRRKCKKVQNGILYESFP